MTDNHLSSGATRESTQENIGEASSVRMSMREIAEQKLSQLGRYIKSAYNTEEDNRWTSFDEPR